MSYEVELSNEAAGVLRAVSPGVRDCILNHLDRLAEAPLELGRRAAFPYRPVGQIYEFWCEDDELRVYLTIFFHFTESEDTIRIFTIGRREYDSKDGM
jgi:hypothetical protein